MKVLGWDAAGVVREVGSAVEGFAPGDEVWYAGSLVRPGADSELHLVDERIAARKPASLDFAQAAALPLTTVTAGSCSSTGSASSATAARAGPCSSWRAAAAGGSARSWCSSPPA